MTDEEKLDKVLEEMFLALDTMTDEEWYELLDKKMAELIKP